MARTRYLLCWDYYLIYTQFTHQSRMNEQKLIESERALGYLYEAYTDGSCENVKTKIGGSAYVILKDGEIVKTQSKGFCRTTNNRMEMLAIISAVNSIPENTSILVYTDSKYCITAFDGRMHKANQDLIKLFAKISSKRKNVFFKWVKGHSGNEFNELADNLAFNAYCEMTKSLGLKVPERMFKTH